MNRNKLQAFYRNKSFHWKGRTKQGVTIWSGSLTPLLVTGRVFSVYGLLAGIGALTALAYGLFAGNLVHALPGALVLMGLIHGVVFGGIGQWSLRMRRYVQRLAPPDVVRERFGIDSAGLKRLASERNIRPRIILNDEPYYDPADVVEALCLLRASSAAPAAADGLLRAAIAPVDVGSSASLLHANCGPSDEQHRRAAEQELQVMLEPLNRAHRTSSAAPSDQSVEINSNAR